MATKTKKTENKTQEFTMQDVFALWKRQAKNGGSTYFSGKTKEGMQLRGFFNTNKKNPKEPDLRVYTVDDGNLSKEPFISMWCNVSKSGSKYLTGKLGDLRVVGFIRKSDNEKAPYLSAYISEEGKQQKIDLPKEPETAEEPKTADEPF